MPAPRWPPPATPAVYAALCVASQNLKCVSIVSLFEYASPVSLDGKGHLRSLSITKFQCHQHDKCGRVRAHSPPAPLCACKSHLCSYITSVRYQSLISRQNIIYFCKGEEFNNFTSQIRSPDLSPPLCAVEPLGTNDTYLGHRTLILMSLFNSSENRAPIPTIGCVLPPSHILQSKLLVIVGLQQSILNNEAMSNKDIK